MTPQWQGVAPPGSPTRAFPSQGEPVTPNASSWPESTTYCHRLTLRDPAKPSDVELEPDSNAIPVFLATADRPRYRQQRFAGPVATHARSPLVSVHGRNHRCAPPGEPGRRCVALRHRAKGPAALARHAKENGRELGGGSGNNDGER